jgi:hypothetical protein
VYGSTREIKGDYQQAPFFARSMRDTHRFIEPVQTYVYLPLVRGARQFPTALRLLRAPEGLDLLHLLS